MTLHSSDTPSEDRTGGSAPTTTESSKRDAGSVISVVCISDTHNKQPELPPGDVLIHAGDMTETGSFDEIQWQLRWLSSQPHPYKIAIAGNHDTLLDEEYCGKYPHRRHGDTSKTRKDLDWGDVIYLEDSAITLEFPVPPTKEPVNVNGNGTPNNGTEDANPPDNHHQKRTLTVYGTPWSPLLGSFPFQYPRNQAESFWTNRIPSETDIVVVHGPPRLHLDGNGTRHAGCPFLAREIGRVRPRLAVFGHIHEAYGREEVVLDDRGRYYEEITNHGGKSLRTSGLCGRASAWVSDSLASFFAGGGDGQRQGPTTFVNAAVVGGGFLNELRNPPVVVEV